MAKVKRIRWDKHPSVTEVNGVPRLKVFEEYFVEEGLPKFQKLMNEEKAKATGEDDAKSSVVADIEMAVDGIAIQPGWLEGEGVARRESDLQAAHGAKWGRNRYVRLRLNRPDANQTDQTTPHGFMHAIKSALRWIKGKAKTEPEAMSVEDTFRLAKEDELYVTTEDMLRSRAIAASLVKRFTDTCQFGMAKKVEDHLSVLAAKINLTEHGMCRYLTEEQAVSFITQAEKGVQVEFLRYYPEVIPNDVAKKMAECNLAMLFDNYVVMYYSTNAKPARLLEEAIDDEERHRRRDPILFGTIRGDRNLYYVADWVYKDDDLTLATVEKAIGTLPTLKDERISDSQLKIEELIHEVRDGVEKAIAEAKETGHFIVLPEIVENPPNPAPPDQGAQQ